MIHINFYGRDTQQLNELAYQVKRHKPITETSTPIRMYVMTYDHDGLGKDWCGYEEPGWTLIVVQTMTVDADLNFSLFDTGIESDITRSLRSILTKLTIEALSV